MHRWVRRASLALALVTMAGCLPPPEPVFYVPVSPAEARRRAILESRAEQPRLRRTVAGPQPSNPAKLQRDTVRRSAAAHFGCDVGQIRSLERENGTWIGYGCGKAASFRCATTVVGSSTEIEHRVLCTVENVGTVESVAPELAEALANMPQSQATQQKASRLDQPRSDLGGLSYNQVHGGLAPRIEKARDCYRRNPDEPRPSHLRVALRVRASGAAEISSLSPTPSPPIMRCLREAFANTTIQAPEEEFTVRTSVDLNVEPDPDALPAPTPTPAQAPGDEEQPEPEVCPDGGVCLFTS